MNYLHIALLASTIQLLLAIFRHTVTIYVIFYLNYFLRMVSLNQLTLRLMFLQILQATMHYPMYLTE